MVLVCADRYLAHEDTGKLIFPTIPLHLCYDCNKRLCIREVLSNTLHCLALPSKCPKRKLLPGHFLISNAHNCTPRNVKWMLFLETQTPELGLGGSLWFLLISQDELESNRLSIMQSGISYLKMSMVQK